MCGETWKLHSQLIELSNNQSYPTNLDYIGTKDNPTHCLIDFLSAGASCLESQRLLIERKWHLNQLTRLGFYICAYTSGGRDPQLCV